MLKKLKAINYSNSNIIKEGPINKSSNKKNTISRKIFSIKKGGLCWYSSQPSMETSNFISLLQIKLLLIHIKKERFGNLE